MAIFAHDDIKPFDDNAAKKTQIRHMFDDIAPRYDLLNRFLSAGIDKIWRRIAIKTLKPFAPRHILDMATGTADMALMAYKLLKPQKITGIDLSEQMLAGGRKKVASAGLSNVIELVNGDSETINFPDNTFDAVMVAFGIRNFENLQKGLTELQRVLKPNAPVVVLEFSKPVVPVVRSLYNLYMDKVACQIAAAFGQNKKAYQYLNKSAQAFPDRENLVRVLSSAGFSNIKFQPLTFGVCCIYTGQKL